MKVINKLEQPENKFDLIFMAYDSPGAVDAGKHWTDREGVGTDYAHIGSCLHFRRLLK